MIIQIIFKYIALVIGILNIILKIILKINVENNVENNIENNIEKQYMLIMKKLQFKSVSNINPKNLLIKYKNEKIEQKTMIRILSELSNLRKNLPLNWESTIWICVPKN
jgi:allophanate hydrolase subunit 1